MNVFSRARRWDLDLDHYLNRIIPPSPLHKFPTRISRFLGYRKTQEQDVGNVLGAFWSMLGAFCGLAVIAATFNNMDSIQLHHPPALIASFGASAILEYNAVRSPLGQPRNALLGHTFSALIGVGISKLFQHHADYDSIKWIAGAVGCGIASAMMLLTNTVHPPGGASAVLAATEPAITAMGWYFVGLVMWGTTLMVVVGLVINNIQRQFPVYWWTPLDLRRAKKDDEETVPDGQGGVEKKTSTAQAYTGERGRILITGGGIHLPHDLSLDAEERLVLEKLSERMQWRAGGGAGDAEDEKEGERRSNSERSSADFTVVASRENMFVGVEST